jgi:hypothetical protein
MTESLAAESWRLKRLEKMILLSMILPTRLEGGADPFGGSEDNAG